MARFDVYRSKDGKGPLLLDCQADILSGLETRLIVPLFPPPEAPRPARHLNPTLDVSGKPYVMMTQYAGAMDVQDLGQKVGSLAEHSYEITSALDFLLTGV